MIDYIRRLLRQLVILTIAMLPWQHADAANPRVELKTTMGTIVIDLYPENAPKTVENFLQYVRQGFYNGAIFHRVMPGFMAQGGGFTPDMKEKKTREAIRNEAGNGLRNAIGTVAMARTKDPHSATAQFFINVAENDFLDFKSADEQGYGYTVFGLVTHGMDVVNRIVKVPTHTVGAHQNVPRQTILIESARIVAAPAGTKPAK